MARSDPALTPVLAQLDPGFVSRIWNDKKITAHHAIIPTRQVFDIRALSEDELKVYLLIRQHYLYTGSQLARTMLNDWSHYVDDFIQVTPIEYKRVLAEEQMRKLQQKIAEVQSDY